MSVISRYEVRLRCMTLATELSSSQEPLDEVFEKAEKIYGWVNQVGNVNKKRPRNETRNETRNEKPHKPTRYNPQDRYREQQQQHHYRSQKDSQPDMFD